MTEVTVQLDLEARDALLFSTDLEARLAAMFASIEEFGERYDEPSDDLDGYPSGDRQVKLDALKGAAEYSGGVLLALAVVAALTCLIKMF